VPFQRRTDSRNALGQQCGSSARKIASRIRRSPEEIAIWVSQVSRRKISVASPPMCDDAVRAAGAAAADVLEAQDVGDRVTGQVAAVDADPEHTRRAGSVKA
jgi:hypothetical protein